MQEGWEQLLESRQAVELKKAWKDYERLVTEFYEHSIIKEWDESLHPRDELGRFTESGNSLPKDSSGRSYSHPALALPKKEYGKVTHLINNVYETRYKGKRAGFISIGHSTYTFEIHDFNEYNIYEKEKF